MASDTPAAGAAEARLVVFDGCAAADGSDGEHVRLELEVVEEWVHLELTVGDDDKVAAALRVEEQQVPLQCGMVDGTNNTAAPAAPEATEQQQQQQQNDEQDAEAAELQRHLRELQRENDRLQGLVRQVRLAGVVGC